MKMFFWLLLLGIVVFFMVRRVQDYGYPWEDQVVLTNYDTNSRFRGGSEQFYVFGEVQNRTRKQVSAVIECKAVPGGMTLTPKATYDVQMDANETVPFDMAIRSRQNATGAECKIGDWTAGDGLEARVMHGARRMIARIKAGF